MERMEPMKVFPLEFFMAFMFSALGPSATQPISLERSP